jgi:indolepyruvate ferredoxin oxidoreductase beta subunit
VDSLALAERTIDPPNHQRGALTQEAGRWLALWMCYDDVIRVADLKSRSSRAQRVRAEVKAQAADLVKVYDHFKPGVPEFAALLPRGLGQRLEAWDARRVAKGLAAWNLPLKVGSHSVMGMVALRCLAAMRFMRPHSARYAQEQALIDRWLAAVMAGTHRDWQLGMELAQCGRLIKGYGSTNERAKRNLVHIVDALARPDRFASDEGLRQTISAVAAARTAALQDEAGKALDSVLVNHGASARPVQAVPIRWVKKPPGVKRQAT